MSSIRCNWWAETPFLLAHIKWKACSHLWSAIFDRSMTVFMVTVKSLRQAASAQRNTPGFLVA